MSEDTNSKNLEPVLPIEKILQPFNDFIRIESSGGIVLILSTILALVWANSPWGGLYESFKNMTVTIGAGDFVLSKPAVLWINDGLMAVFFFLVGLEIKREVLVGELNSLKHAMLPIFAAVGGMVAPALFYALFNHGTPSADGWGIPMATDIAFSLGILSLLGKRAPLSLKIFLTAVAIVDDIGAILVIAIFYSAGISLYLIGFAIFLLVVMFVMNKLGVRSPIPYVILGGLMWLAFLKSGIHATVAGVLAAMAIPARSEICCNNFLVSARDSLGEYEMSGGSGDTVLSNKRMLSALGDLHNTVLLASPPLKRIEHNLHYWVAFGIMPIFALANAGIDFTPDNGTAINLFHPVSFGIICGLILGKVVGICLASFIAVKSGAAEMPSGMVPGHFFGASLLAGIGFTMSIFITTLAWDDSSEFIATAKLSILIASAIAGLAGFLVLRTCRLSVGCSIDN
jgi:NhaA family Na+:H+ antiporter